MGQLGHTHFGVTHGGWRIAIHRTEVTLAIDEHVTQRERLRHAHHGVVHRGITVWMILTDHIADDTRRFLVSLVPVVAEFAHGEQHATMYGFQTITHTRQRASA